MAMDDGMQDGLSGAEGAFDETTMAEPGAGFDEGAGGVVGDMGNLVAGGMGGGEFGGGDFDPADLGTETHGYIDPSEYATDGGGVDSGDDLGSLVGAAGAAGETGGGDFGPIDQM